MDSQNYKDEVKELGTEMFPENQAQGQLKQRG